MLKDSGTEKIILGTRGSILALAQAEKVKEMLLKKYEEYRKDGKKLKKFENTEKLEIEIKVIVTRGDKDLRDFGKIKGDSQKDMFVKEIEREMLEGTVDFAVHSLKDMPQVTPAGLLNACFPLREENCDALVSRNGKKLEELDGGSIIGTGSTRREAELLNLRKDIRVKPIRGNIHTRLKKLDDGEYDAIVLAYAGLKRTGLESRVTQKFGPDEFMPAPGQGILCVQCREDDEKIRELLEIIDDGKTRLMCEAEREFSRIFDGGCHTPVGCSSEITDESIEIKAMYSDNGRRILEKIAGNKKDSVKLAGELAEKIRRKIFAEASGRSWNE